MQYVVFRVKKDEEAEAVPIILHDKFVKLEVRWQLGLSFSLYSIPSKMWLKQQVFLFWQS